MTLIDTERGGLSEPNTFWTDQFHNEDAVRGYMEIGRELMEQTGGGSTCSAAPWEPAACFGAWAARCGRE
jgi:hypothetical protein